VGVVVCSSATDPPDCQVAGERTVKRRDPPLAQKQTATAQVAVDV